MVGIGLSGLGKTFVAVGGVGLGMGACGFTTGAIVMPEAGGVSPDAAVGPAAVRGQVVTSSVGVGTGVAAGLALEPE